MVLLCRRSGRKQWQSAACGITGSGEHAQISIFVSRMGAEISVLTLCHVVTHKSKRLDGKGHETEEVLEHESGQDAFDFTDA